MAGVACMNCGSNEMFRSVKPVSAGGGHAPNYLPGLGGWAMSEKFHVIICGHCGLTQLYARPEALDKLPTSSKWERL
ncbi:MAG TPA: hypothetical protein VFU06_12240 [Longimicrobiales bacterium]|nr:hypothetical protein [Longimicrobiales bacterium]